LLIEILQGLHQEERWLLKHFICDCIVWNSYFIHKGHVSVWNLRQTKPSTRNIWLVWSQWKYRKLIRK
jgi:hypothetical protein